mmetsp:Transcript_54412/g.145195  ORF Transcript_54412/g.145195 Transcript_54412/m.145195 type:complete len:337 (-) Transcript_54412:739-1749(-)
MIDEVPPQVVLLNLALRAHLAQILHERRDGADKRRKGHEGKDDGAYGIDALDGVPSDHIHGSRSKLSQGPMQCRGVHRQIIPLGGAFRSPLGQPTLYGVVPHIDPTARNVVVHNNDNHRHLANLSERHDQLGSLEDWRRGQFHGMSPQPKEANDTNEAKQAHNPHKVDVAGVSSRGVRELQHRNGPVRGQNRQIGEEISHEIPVDCVAPPHLHETVRVESSKEGDEHVQGPETCRDQVHEESSGPLEDEKGYIQEVGGEHEHPTCVPEQGGIGTWTQNETFADDAVICKQLTSAKLFRGVLPQEFGETHHVCGVRTASRSAFLRPLRPVRPHLGNR